MLFNCNIINTPALYTYTPTKYICQPGFAYEISAANGCHCALFWGITFICLSIPKKIRHIDLDEWLVGYHNLWRLPDHVNTWLTDWLSTGYKSPFVWVLNNKWMAVKLSRESTTWMIITLNYPDDYYPIIISLCVSSPGAEDGELLCFKTIKWQSTGSRQWVEWIKCNGRCTSAADRTDRQLGTHLHCPTLCVTRCHWLIIIN